MKRSARCVLFLAAVAAVLFSGCGSSPGEGPEAEERGRPEAAGAERQEPAEAEDAEADGNAAAENGAGAAGENVPAGTEEKFYIYSWNGELGERLEYIYAADPEIRDRVEYVSVGSREDYQEEIDRLLQNPEAEEYPDLIVFETDYIMKYTNSDFTIPVTDCGLTEVDLMEMFPYTITAASDRRDYELKGVSWQCRPGFFLYRADLAEALLGVKNPDEMQARIGSWEDFLETAREIREKSGDGIRMLSSVSDAAAVFMTGRNGPWVDSDGVFRMEDTMFMYMDVAYALENEELTCGTGRQETEHGTGLSGDSVFGCFEGAWGLYGDEAHYGTALAGGEIYGPWNICQGPAPFFLGGTWLGATAGCSDTVLAGRIMKALCCDTEVMTEIARGTGDYVNNKSAMKALSDEGKGSFAFLGGQNFIEAVFPIAEAADTSWMCAYDREISELLDAQVSAYIKGEKEKERAVADFKNAVAQTWPSLTVE